ncbi:MAG: DNA recombination protein RmuC [Parcubacteria group bacterium]|nr:DNA recombination protein RmuC [Parcubacteria group bacterium]
MSFEFIILTVTVLAGFAGLFWFLSRRVKSAEPENRENLFLMLQNQIADLSRILDNKLGESHRSMQTQFGQTTQIVKDVTERLTKLDETNRQVVNFADQLKNLQDILKNPKQRGILGEYYLETLLKNVLPPGSYQMQYPFKDGTIVDAAVFVKDKIIPVDSKFSLENYNRLVEEKNEAERARLEKVFINDLKLRIQETSKYIQPAQNTMDFAFMFIPHEAIYYDLLVSRIGVLQDEDTENLIQRAANKYKVIIVSPTSFLAYLQTVMQGLRALQIEESAKEIIKRVGELNKHLAGYETYLGKMGNHLGTTVSMYNQAYKEFGKIDKDVLKITGEKIGAEPMVLDAPRMDKEE